ncbi:MAG: GNAT family N-acetyltransferase [Lachnospiraceae bacterium]|nr:GNAT family N-acetyltransferase [Lachnospiraceae bacterium]
MKIRELRKGEEDLLKDFLYEAVFIPEGVEPPAREIIELPELRIYYEDFGGGAADLCLVATVEKTVSECPAREDATKTDYPAPAKNEKVVGAVWTRLMKDYGYVDDETPSFAISLYKEYRGKGYGTKLMQAMLELLRSKGFKRASLAVQKANYAVRMYEKVGFVTVDQNEEEYIMTCDL